MGETTRRMRHTESVSTLTNFYELNTLATSLRGLEELDIGTSFAQCREELLFLAAELCQQSLRSKAENEPAKKKQHRFPRRVANLFIFRISGLGRIVLELASQL